MEPRTSTNNKYVLLQSFDGGFKVNRLEPKIVRQTTIENGVESVTLKTYEELFHTSPGSLLKAWPKGAGWWDVDTEAGFMRWFGTKSTRELFAAVRRLGFTEEDIKAIKTHAKPQLQ